jgi:hypothetical protein
MMTRDMKYAQGTYNHEEEVNGININLGNVEIESNGHREGKAKNIELVETMRIPKREVLSYKADNERIIRA